MVVSRKVIFRLTPFADSFFLLVGQIWQSTDMPSKHPGRMQRFDFFIMEYRHPPLLYDFTICTRKSFSSEDLALISKIVLT